MDQMKIAAIIFIICGVLVFQQTIFLNLRKKKIHRLVPIKDWKILRIIQNFGLPRHEIITPKNHPNIYWFIIIRDIISATLTIAVGIIIFFWDSIFKNNI